MNSTISQMFLKELETEVAATRKCLERISEDLYEYKPHEKSMQMGYLALLVADIPKWITYTIKEGEIDLGTWEKFKLNKTADLLEYFDHNIEEVKKVLAEVSDEVLEEMFYLKMGGQELMKSSKKESVSSSLNHWVHHRGQLTVYMRLNDIAVPSIYGPSADDKTF